MTTSELEEKLVYYSEPEEQLNRITHGAGALVSIAAVVDLLVLAASQHDSYRMVSASIYGASMIIFFCLSTAYHSVREPNIRYLFRILDHASIYLMIAGSYTPFALVTLRGPWGWSLFGIVWGLGAIGAAMKIFTTHRLPYIGPLLYISLGWIVVIAFKPLSAALATSGMVLLFAGGIAYTLGVVFYLWDRIPYNHAIWHLFVLTGAACHFLAIYGYVIPRSL
jgi:hemolysin III